MLLSEIMTGYESGATYLQISTHRPNNNGNSPAGTVEELLGAADGETDWESLEIDAEIMADIAEALSQLPGDNGLGRPSDWRVAERKGERVAVYCG